MQYQKAPHTAGLFGIYAEAGTVRFGHLLYCRHMKKNLKEYFIPSRTNGYAPHILQKAALFGMAIMVMLSFTMANVHSLIWISSQWMISTILPAVIVDLTNEERAEGALGTLRRSSVLDEAARLKAEDMAAHEYFAHYSPDGVSPWHWFGEVSYNFVHAGENLAIHFTDSGDVVDAWMESPSHRANIMNGNYSEIGVGTAEGTYQGYPTVYVVQLFGTPAAVAAHVPEPAAPIAVAQAPSVPVTNEALQEVAAESVSLTEEVVVHEAEPVPVAVAEETVPAGEESAPAVEETAPVEEGTSVAEKTAQNEEIPASAENTVPRQEHAPVIITDMTSDAYGVVLYSDHISTSTNAIAAPVAQEAHPNEAQVPFYLKLATQPHVVLEIIYITIGCFVLASLLLSIFIEVRYQQPVQIAYGAGLLAIIGMLYYMHMLITSGALIV